MNDDRFHDILMIWLLRRLDLIEAKRSISRAYQELFDNGELDHMSRDDITMYMLEILDRFEIPHPIRNLENFKIVDFSPF